MTVFLDTCPLNTAREPPAESARKVVCTEKYDESVLEWTTMNTMNNYVGKYYENDEMYDYIYIYIM